MLTVEELLTVVDALEEALIAWRASGFADDKAIQNAVTYHMKLAPVFSSIYGRIPMLVTSYPPHVVLRREEEHVKQARSALESGYVTNEYLERTVAGRNATGVPTHIASVLETIDQLLAEGRKFTYGNFSAKSSLGYPVALSEEWVSWTARVEATLNPILDRDSSAAGTLRAGLGRTYVGFGEDVFTEGCAEIVGALAACRDLVASGQSPLAEPEVGRPASERSLSDRVFVVHGHAEAAKSTVEVFLTKHGLEPVVLHEQPDKGRTVIEKFEDYADVGFAVVLLTPDDLAFPADEPEPAVERGSLRARPNVLFEFGYFVGRLGRDRVCCLYTGDVELPSDLGGLLYKAYEKAVSEVFYELLMELRAAGYDI